MRVNCKPEEAEIAIKEGIEWRKTTAPWPWVSDGMPSMSTAQLVKLGATFEKQLPEVGDGKEYEYKKGSECSGPKPKGVMIWNRHSSPTRWELSVEMPWAINSIYAIPLKKSCVVEGVVRDRFDVVPNHIICEGIPADTEVYVLPKEGTTRHYARWDQGRICIQDEAWVGKALEVLVREIQP